MRAFLVAILTLLIVLPVSGQDDVPDSRGTDFWFTFLPNFHNGIDELPTDVAQQLEHELYIYIGSEVPTSGTITMTDQNGAVRTVSFIISDPTKLYEFRTFFLPYELRGCNYHGTLDYLNMQNEKPAPQSFHVQSTDDVSVYALNQGRLTSEAFMVLPTDALGDDYVIMSYTSDIRIDGPSGVVNGGSTPTEFAVVATEDSTVVEIIPTATTFKSQPGERQSVLLNQGESYLVQAHPEAEFESDLTGSVVSATRPVAVFSGHQRALIPIELQGVLGSRDCLVEQMNPIRTWGKTAFVIPFAQSSDELPRGTDLYRVVSAFDSTVVFVDGIETTILDEGQFYQAELTQPHHITTSRPAMVGMYKKTSGSASGLDSRYGDPFMMLVPPPEQFLNAYRFVNVQANQFSIIGGIPQPINTIYKEQWLNVVITTQDAASLRLDGQPLTATFRPIGTTGYSYAQVRMTDGVHGITADTIFGIYVYGFGEANSYGYIGGMAFRPLDVFPPSVKGSVTCGVLKGAVTDSLRGDTRIKSVSVVPGSDVNTLFTLASFSPPQAVVGFEVALVDPLLDGQITIAATDHVQQRTTSTLLIPGFTVGVVGRDADPLPETRSRIIPIGQNRCDTVTLQNYGRFPRTITSMRTTGKGTITEPPLPVTLPPGMMVDVIVCRTSDSAGIERDTLIIGDTCLERSVMAVEIDVRDDREGPDVTGAVDPCSTSVVVTVADDRPFDFGLRSVRVMTEVLQNCTVEQRTTSVARETYLIQITDPFQDAVYGFEAVDSADNRTQTIDTIPGFTLAINGEGGSFSSRSMSEVTLGSVRCDTITLTNYGSRPQVLRDVLVAGNVRFSVPQHQFAIVVPPGGSAPLVVCYEPRDADEDPDLDTLIFLHGCADKRLEVSANGSPVVFQGLTRCDVPVELNVERLSSTLTVMPQPATDVLTLVLGQASTSIHVRLVDLQGADVLAASWTGDPTRSVRLDLSPVASGTYGLVVRSDTGTARTIVVVE